MTVPASIAATSGALDRRDLVATLFHATGATSLLGLVLNSRLLRGPIVRAVSYHETPERDRASFRRHLQYYLRRMTALGEGDLGAFLSGALTLERPGLLLTFDDGFKNNYTVAADVLDEFGVKGFFFVPINFMATADQPESARGFVSEHLYEGHAPPTTWPIEDYLPMSWADLRELVRRGHSVGCHGMQHQALGPLTDASQLQREVVEAKVVLEKQLGAPVSCFCWPFGTLASYSREAFALIRQHYRYAFTTFGAPLFAGDDPYTIDRARVEPRMGLARVSWAVQGPAEIYLRNRRKQFEAIVGHDVR